MLRLDDNSLVLAATDLTNHLACRHLTQQRLAIARGERGKPRPVDDPHADLLRTRGERHEDEQLQRLTAECGGPVDLSTAGLPFTREGLEAGADSTKAAMRDGAPLIYQAQFFDGRWQGRTDFLRRVPVPSDLGDHSYEVIDTKLARQVKPQVVHQLSLYNRMLASVQGLSPAFAHLILGDGTEHPIDLRRYAALHRHAIRRLESIVHGDREVTYPEPVAHCGICALATECYARRVEDDHLSLVAGARRDQRERLVEQGLPTVLSLAEAPAAHDPGPLGPERFDVLHHQAALQVESRVTKQPRHRHLEPERAAGYAILPDPSSGDIFFDLEGDPYVGDGGIEYLWGWWTTEGGYERVWAHDLDAEKLAFEAFIDRVKEMRRNHPELHIYHYAPHELSKLRSLSVKYATREEEVDDLLRSNILVDLYAVVRHAMQVGEDSYSLKRLERHHDFTRLEHRVREGGGSIVAYERWLETEDDELLEWIRAYNEEDCRSTWSLREWLVQSMRPEAATQFNVDFDELREPEAVATHPAPEWLDDVLALVDRLIEGLAADGAEDDPSQAERRLLAHMLLYHRREGKPEWWRHFDLRAKTVAELVFERDAVGDLNRDESVAPVPVKRSFDYTFTFPPQEFRLATGDAIDPGSGKSLNLIEIDDRRLALRSGAKAGPPSPRALIGKQPIDPKVLRNALVELADSVLAEDGRFAAVEKLMRREGPGLDEALLGEDAETLSAAALALDDAVLPIQGPPGTGKTFRAARMVLAALAKGRRVGITAPSHAAIQNLLHDVEECANEKRQSFTGVYKGHDYESTHGLIEMVDDNKAVTDEFDLVAGTAWLFTREEHRQAFNLLFVDEAGQFSLANAAAAGLSSRSLVLLGDPQQLPQVTQADHPEGSGTSVLEHLLEGANTIQPGRGVLLTESWRMHPDVCEFISERSYDGLLRSRTACEGRRIDAPNGAISGTGLRALPVAHEGRSQTSPEEADAIAEACASLLGGATVTDDESRVHTLQPKDIMVVAPYNLAVHSIADRVPDGVRVGTVDRFQGQQAAVVFYAMTCSSGDDVPRGLDFLFDSHRLNVAISRAQCIAVLVHSPDLLDADAPTLEAMELVDGVCRFVELARPVASVQ